MFEIILLKTFVTVAETKHFTAAAQALKLSQSTVSQHIRRLELASGRQLLARDTHAVELTPDGLIMAGFAKEVLAASQRAADYFSGTAPRGRVRFGVSEDLAMTQLPSLLRDFMVAHPLLSVELSVGLTGMLYSKLDAGLLDLVFAKRPEGDDRGEVIQTETLRWMAPRHFELDVAAPVPLILYAASSITSRLAIEALAQVNRPWFTACSSETLSGLKAAVLAGLGVTAQSRLLLQTGDLVEAPASLALPPLGDIEFVVVARSAKPQGAVAALMDVIIEQGPQLWDVP